MLNRLCINTRRIFLAMPIAACISTVCATTASSQILPEVWATVGSVDDLVSYGAGVRFVGTGIEVGTGEDGATGGDFLTFINLPVKFPFEFIIGIFTYIFLPHEFIFIACDFISR